MRQDTMKTFAPNRTAFRQSSFPAVLLIAGLCAASPVLAAGPTAPRAHDLTFVPPDRVVRVTSDTVSLIAGLLGIERDLLLGQLFLHDGLVSTEGSHFTHPRQEDFAAIKDALAKIGAPDLEPLLIALESATDQKSVDAAYINALAGVKRAKELLEPTGHDVLAAVIETAEESLSMLDPSGTSDVTAYQESWGLLMVARGELDHLLYSTDPAVKKRATKMVLAFDDVILSAPDPAARGPVTFDPAIVATLIATLNGELDSI